MTARHWYNWLGLVLPGVLVGAFWWVIAGMFWVGLASGGATMFLLIVLNRTGDDDAEY